MVPKPVKEIKQKNMFSKLPCLLFCQDLLGTWYSALPEAAFSCTVSDVNVA